MNRAGKLVNHTLRVLQFEATWKESFVAFSYEIWRDFSTCFSELVRVAPKTLLVNHGPRFRLVGGKNYDLDPPCLFLAVLDEKPRSGAKTRTVADPSRGEVFFRDLVRVSEKIPRK